MSHLRSALATVGAVCALLVVPVGTASAFNSGTPPGPPALSGSPNGAIVGHCKAFGGKGVVVANKHGIHFHGPPGAQACTVDSVTPPTS